jgi:small GTP-binding protein
MQLWDTAGQERFRAIVQPYYRDADAAILVIDATNALSQQEVEDYWLPELKKHAPNCRPWVFISKCDLPHGDYAVDWSKRNQLGWRKVSSKTGEGVGEGIEAIVRQLTLEKPRIENTRIVMSLNEFTPPPAKKKCC